MAAYLFANVEVTDPVAYDEYRKGVAASLEPFNGRFLVRGGASEHLEGPQGPNRLVIIEFPDKAALSAWYASDIYKPLLAKRKAAARSTVYAVEGV